MTDLIRVLIADDHSLVRAGFQSVLSIESDITVVGEARNGAEAVSNGTGDEQGERDHSDQAFHQAG